MNGKKLLKSRSRFRCVNTVLAAASVENPGWEIDVMGVWRSTVSRTVLMRPSPRLYDPAPTLPCRAGARLTRRQVKVTAPHPHTPPPVGSSALVIAEPLTR